MQLSLVSGDSDSTIEVSTVLHGCRTYIEPSTHSKACNGRQRAQGPRVTERSDEYVTLDPPGEAAASPGKGTRQARYFRRQVHTALHTCTMHAPSRTRGLRRWRL